MIDLQRVRPDLVEKHALANEAALEGTAFDRKGADEKPAVEPDHQSLTWIRGFPKILSFIDGTRQAEILMEALGTNLGRMLKQCPAKKLSKTTAYKITLQLVSFLSIISITPVADLCLISTFL